MEEKGSSGPEISMGVAEEKPKASEDIGEMKYEEYLCKLETAAKGGMLDVEYNKEKQNLDHIGKHYAKTEEIRLKTQASRQALERTYLEIKAVYGDSANKSRGKGEPGHGKSSSLTRICPKCGRLYPEKYKFCIRKECFTDKKGTRLIYRAKCSSCGSDLIEYEGKSEIRHCPECGKALPEKQARIINATTERKEKYEPVGKYCEECKKTYTDENTDVCPECGTLLKELKCECGAEYIKGEDGEYNRYCVECGKETIFVNREHRKGDSKVEYSEDGKDSIMEFDFLPEEEEPVVKKEESKEEQKKQWKWKGLSIAFLFYFFVERSVKTWKWKEWLIALLLIAIGIFIVKGPNDSVQQYKVGDKIYKVEDKIKFGSYPFYEDGREKAIDWIILDIKANGNALIISDYALDNVEYNGKWGDITWEDSSIRKWLNNEFLNKAFTASEQSKIKTTKVSTADNKGKWSDGRSWHTRGGNDTNDKLFLLSIEEAKKYFSSDEKRRLLPTPYAKGSNSKNGELWTDADYGGSCWWWLRSPGSSEVPAAYVNSDGNVYSYGYFVRGGNFAVRVALWLDLNNL